MEPADIREEVFKLKRVLKRHLERKDRPGVVTTPVCHELYDAIEEMLEELDGGIWSIEEVEEKFNKLVDAKKAVSEYSPKRELAEGETYHPKNLEYIWAMFDLNVAICNFYRLLSQLRQDKDIHTI